MFDSFIAFLFDDPLGEMILATIVAISAIALLASAVTVGVILYEEQAAYSNQSPGIPAWEKPPLRSRVIT